MSIPSPLRDHLFVQVALDTLDRTASGILIPDWQPGDKDAEQATVVAVPLSLSDRHLAYANMDGRAYRFRDLLDLPRVGETVYLKRNTFKPELEYPGHPGVYLVPLDKVIAVGNADGLRGFQGILLCEPVYGDDVRVNERGIRERVARHRVPGPAVGWDTEVGLPYHEYKELVVEPDPLPIPFTLRILHTGPPLNNQPDVVQVGDTILAHKMLFAHHAVKNRDGDEGEGRGRWMWQCAEIKIGNTLYSYVPRQCVMAKLETAMHIGNGRQVYASDIKREMAHRKSLI